MAERRRHRIVLGMLAVSLCSSCRCTHLTLRRGLPRGCHGVIDDAGNFRERQITRCRMTESLMQPKVRSSGYFNGANTRRLASIGRGGGGYPVEDTKNEVAVVSRGRIQRIARQTLGGLFSAVGFVSSSAISLVSNRKQFRQWKKGLDGLDAYLDDSGIASEIPKFGEKLMDNVIILGRIQSAMLRNRDIRDLAPMRRRAYGRPGAPPSHREAARYMKFATAAYGEAMIRAAEMHTKGRFDAKVTPLPRKKIAQHVGLPEDDIVQMDLDDAEGDLNHLRHFVAVDRTNKNVVLSIRGTFTLSEIVVDVVAFSRPFMGGEAHSEMATMAERLWERTGGTVRDLLLKEGTDYGLVITGHSLGAGVASLLNILIHQDKRRHVLGRQVRCFAFAAPPVFAPLQMAPREAIRSTTNYIHERDAVPFLSVNSFRRFFSSLSFLDSSQNLTWVERQKLVIGHRSPDESLREGVLQASLGLLPPRRGAPLLAVPAARNVWVRERNDSDGEYDAKLCDSTRLAKLGIVVHPSMLLDHFPTKYEEALDYLDSQEGG